MIVYKDNKTGKKDKVIIKQESMITETEYLGIVGGTLIKQSFNLNGNIIVKEAVLK